MPDFTYENQMYEKGYTAVCGCDEAGRGPRCGPGVAAAVILPRDCVIEGLDDSKKLTEKKREKLYDVICREAVAYGIAESSPAEIDDINILNASMLAMRRAVDKLSVKADFAIIDGNHSRGFSIDTLPLVGGDHLSYSVAASSVLAKVTRDRMCERLDKEYPGYGIAKHKGYPTKEHMDAVRRLGPTPIYRKTFLKFLDK